MSKNPVHMEHIAPFEQKVQAMAGMQPATRPRAGKTIRWHLTKAMSILTNGAPFLEVS
jgi:hypothetical protein